VTPKKKGGQKKREDVDAHFFSRLSNGVFHVARYREQMLEM